MNPSKELRAVTDLKALSLNKHSIELQWTVPETDGYPARQTSYDLRYATEPITELNWHAAAQMECFAQREPGKEIVYYANELETGRRYYFAVKMVDNDGHVSALSNVASETTIVPTPDSCFVSSLEQLQEAIDSAPPSGRIITLAAGVYRMEREILIKDKNNITIQGATEDYADTVIIGPGMDDESVRQMIDVHHSHYITLQHMTLQDSYYYAVRISHHSIYFHANHLKTWDNGECGFKGHCTSFVPWRAACDYGVIENCLIGFTTCGRRSVIEGIDLIAAKGWKIRHNTFKNIQPYEGKKYAFSFFAKGNSIDTVVENNLFIDNCIGPSFGGGGTGVPWFRHGDITYEHRGGVIRNNLIINSKEAGVYLKRAKDFTICGNIIISDVSDNAIQTDEYVGWLRGVGNPDANSYYGDLAYLQGKLQIPVWMKEAKETGDSTLLHEFGEEFIPGVYSHGAIYNNIMRGHVTLKHGARATLQNNVTDADEHIFVDAKNGDYRLKSRIDSPVLSTLDKFHRLKEAGYLPDADNGDRLEEPIDRASFAGILAAVATGHSPHGATNISSVPAFTDVPAGFRGYRGIAIVAQANLMQGNERNEFMPEERLTVEQMAAALVRLLHIDTSGLHSVPGASAWASQYVAAALAFGLIREAASYSREVTRGEMVESVYAVLDKTTNSLKPRNIRNAASGKEIYSS